MGREQGRGGARGGMAAASGSSRRGRKRRLQRRSEGRELATLVADSFCARLYMPCIVFHESNLWGSLPRNGTSRVRWNLLHQEEGTITGLLIPTSDWARCGVGAKSGPSTWLPRLIAASVTVSVGTFPNPNRRLSP